MTKAEKAVSNKHNGMNCAQAVAVAFADILQVDEGFLKSVCSGLGLGMGTMEGSCGALVGANVVAGLKSGGNGTSKIAKTLTQKFKEKCGAVTCKDLKGVESGRPICPCDECVKNAVISLCEILEAEGL